MADRTTIDRFWTGFGIWLTALLVGFFIACGVTDSHGRQAWDHVGPVPEGVAQISSDTYLVPVNGASPSEICKGDDGNSTQTVNTSKPIKQLPNTLFVRCVVGQTWSNHNPRSPNFGTAMGRVGSNRTFIIIGSVSLLVMLIPALFAWMGYQRRSLRTRRKERAAARAEAERKRLTVEDQRRELREAYANDEIDQPTFERKLAEILDRHA